MATPTMYGLAHCSTCRKAMAWLDDRGKKYRFVDYRENPLPAAELRRLAALLGWEKLVNRASLTWRALPETEKSPGSERDWLKLVAAHPSLIRRPLLVFGDDSAIAGFSEKRYREAFA